MIGLLILLVIEIATLYFAFIRNTRWQMPDLIATIVLAFVPFFVFTLALIDERQIKGVDDLVAVFPIALIYSFPVFLGAWWSSRVCADANENRPWARIGYLLMGCGLAVGVIAVIPAAMLVTKIWYGRVDAELIKIAAVLLPTVALGIPGACVELRMNRKRRDERRERIRNARQKAQANLRGGAE